MVNDGGRTSVICKLNVGGDRPRPRAYDGSDHHFEAVLTHETRGGDVAVSRGGESVGFSGDMPSTCDARCHWCLETFDGRPFGMPVTRDDMKIAVEGVYCSPSCASAHAFDKFGTSSTAFSRHCMICELCGETRVTPAPPRECLRTFGGPLTIQQFRDAADSTYVVHDHPVVSMTRQLEKMSTNSTRCDSVKYVPLRGVEGSAFPGLRRPENVTKKTSVWP